MTSACRPLTAWRHLAALLCAVALLAPGPAEAQPCTTCARTSFGLAPRSYPAGEEPVVAAAGDLNGDGRADLVVANKTPAAFRVLLGGPTGFVVAASYNPSLTPRGVAIADFDTNGLPDVVVAGGASGSGLVQIWRNQGGGVLAAGVARTAGLDNPSAVVVGDFDGNGTPDVAAASEDSDQVFVFLGDGKGGLDSGHITTLDTGSRPRALVAGFFDAGGILDLAVACPGDDKVRVLLGTNGGNGKGDGTFTAGAILDVGDEPVSLAAGDLDLDTDLDIVTANRLSATVSVLENDGAGGFTLVMSPEVDNPLLGPQPMGVAILRVDDSPRPDIVTSNVGRQSVTLLLDDGTGGFQAATRHPVLVSPQAVVPLDADADGRLDLAVPCKASNAVVVLLTRPPTFSAAKRYTVGAQPVAAVSADLDGDGDLDLAVANKLDSTVSILLNTGAGAFVLHSISPPVGSSPTAIVAGDFDRDGTPDLAVSSGANVVTVLRGTGGGSFEIAATLAAGLGPEDLAVADVDGNGAVDLLVCNVGTSRTVAFLRNNGSVGSISFAPAQYTSVAENPTAIFAGHLNADSFPDFAVANDSDATLTVGYGNGSGSFSGFTTLTLTAPDATPTSVTGADFDGDGDIDLAATVLFGGAVSVFWNDGTSFATSPTRFPAAGAAVHAAAADLNADGKLDLTVATAGLEVLRGRGSLASFEEGEDFVAGPAPLHVVVADFSGEGRPDVAVVNRDSNDVSILLGTGCTVRRLEVVDQPGQPLCPSGYTVEAVVEARDDGGNLACPVGDVTAAIVPGTGTTGAKLSGAGSSGSPPAPPPSVPLTLGVASFTTSNAASLTIDKTGKRYRLQFALPSQPQVPPAVSDSFTLGAQPVILGPTSFCPSAQATYAADPVEGPYDQYMWTLDGAPTPFAYTPSILLGNPPLSGERSYNLTLGVRVDSCQLSTSRTIWYRKWFRTTLSIDGPSTVCVDCLGGTVKPFDEGGGAAVARQWGYRTASGAGQTVTPISGGTAATYVVKGTDFPGPGMYYLVVTSTFTCPPDPPDPPYVSLELPIVVTDQVDGSSEVRFLAVSSRGDSSSGEHFLQWANSTGSPEEICIRWNEAPDSGSSCTFPSLPDCPSPDGPNWHQILLGPPLDAHGTWLHAGVTLDRNYCYAVFVRDNDNTPPWSPGRLVKARAFDSTLGPVKWSYSTGATAVAPPVVGKNGILVMSNDRTVHALTRGSLPTGGDKGGVWPSAWVPGPLEGVAHSRSPIVPFGVLVSGASALLFAGDDQGWVNAVNADNGQTAWARRADQSPFPATITGAPGAILQQYGGNRDLVLVGTRRNPTDSHSDFLGLDPANPDSRVTFTGGGSPLQEPGPVSGAPAVDYGKQRVYFASRRRTGHTVWALDVGASSLTYAWSWDPGGEFDTSPTLRNGRIYLGDTNGSLYSISTETIGSPPVPADIHVLSIGDGPVKGFLFPDRRNDNLIFATNSAVRSVGDPAVGFFPRWTWPIANPSAILYWPGTDYVYVGGPNGRLYQLDFSLANTGTPPTFQERILGDGKGQIGTPTLDVGITTPYVSAGKKLLVVGSESGVVYGVEVPF